MREPGLRFVNCFEAIKVRQSLNDDLNFFVGLVVFDSKTRPESAYYRTVSLKNFLYLEAIALIFFTLKFL
jgi:hypothetical protein